jgi:hypothetical protein
MIHPYHTRKIGIIIAISVSLVALGPITFGSQPAQAQGNPSRDLVQAFDLSGQIVCPDGQSFSADMDFFAVEEPDGDVEGNFIISTADGAKEGVITDLHVTPSRFSAQGTETIDTACAAFGGGIATTVSIKGKCDDNATVEFRAANGQRGTFIGQVLCARVSN